MASQEDKGDVEVYHYSASSFRDLTEEEELFEMVGLSGVPLDKELFKVILELLKLNVAPTNILSVLKTLRSQDSHSHTADDFETRATTSVKRSHDTTAKSHDLASKAHPSTKASHDASKKSHASSKRSHDPPKASDKSKTDRGSRQPKQSSGRSKHRAPSAAAT